MVSKEIRFGTYKPLKKAMRNRAAARIVIKIVINEGQVQLGATYQPNAKRPTFKS